MEKAIGALKSRGVQVLKPGSIGTDQEEYERCVATPNLLYRFSRPDCVVLPKDASQVQAIIQEAKSKRLKVTIKCGGHSYAGHSTAFQGVSLDLRRMKNVKLDLTEMTVTMESGCQWGDVYKTLIDNRRRANGLIILGGRCPPVGVSGFILGGGLSPFTRSFGMGSDTLMEATVVTADGEQVTVTEKHARTSKEGMLFWALSGAGGGNFGVLVSMKLKVQRLRNRDGTVVAGRYQWFPDSEAMETFLATMNSFYTADWPKQMTIDSTWLCDLRQNTGDGVRFTIYFDGNKQAFDNLIDKHVKQPDLARQLKRRSLPEDSTRFLHETLVAQWSEETERSFPTNRTYTIYSSFVFTNDRSTIEKLTTIIKKQMETFRRLYSGEKVEFLWEDKWMERDMRGFLGKVKKELRPYSLNNSAAFINFPDGILAKKGYERAYFGDNRQELRRVKDIWDKDNFFDWDQGIQLPQGAVEDPDGNVDMEDDEKFTDSIAREQWKVFESKDIEADLDYLTKSGF
ncbi:hypothetical protein NUU61_000145 [Penicillium alfredii]|uniref:FAD-binding PCMH-type domain-containing protein n=1 Tax=Penicillium alfredii TaxID=1506179 RepID=A0A9W9G944_9EURO|nr:uncharacterized protein NUU61_000145 [Penicillium alfredii]KAJ5114386.1 hypothetical protein NUU61_000145 [Penicillium alfredii]